jgi:hypothetical protein
MSDERKLSIHFNNGTQMEVSFPKQLKHGGTAVLDAFRRLMESDKLTIEADGRLLVIPWNSVKYLELNPVPSSLPFEVIKGASVLPPKDECV